MEQDFYRQHQENVADWIVKCFGIQALESRRERALRFIEEAIELAQSSGLTNTDVKIMSDYVFNRIPGDVDNEIGGVCVTLNGLASNLGYNVKDCFVKELIRINKSDFVEKVQRKQNSKPSEIKDL
jgi:hypothetical protein